MLVVLCRICAICIGRACVAVPSNCLPSYYRYYPAGDSPLILADLPACINAPLSWPRPFHYACSLLDGQHSTDEVCCEMGMSPKQLDDILDTDPYTITFRK